MHCSIPKLHLGSCAAAVIPLCAVSVLIAVCERQLDQAYQSQLYNEVEASHQALAKAQFQKAETDLRETIERCRKKARYANIKIAAEGVLAELLVRSDRDLEALPFLIEICNYNIMLLGERDRRTAVAENNLGLVYTRTGFAGEANYCLNKALAINESLFGKDSINYAVNLNNLATLKSNFSQYREAENLFKKSLDIKARVSPQSRTLAITLLELSNLYRKQNRLQLSESARLQALKIFQLPQYRDGIEAAMCMNNLAVTKCSLGKMNEAQKLYKQALQIANRSLGEDSHLSTIYRLNLQSLATKKDTAGD